jgi:hypothetical protein
MTPARNGKGTPPVRGRWPDLQTIKRGHFFEVDDLAQHVNLRSAASRAGKRLKRRFSVCKEKNDGGAEVLRVYRTK